MAYFVYKIHDNASGDAKVLEKLEHFDSFQEAKKFARAEREGLAEDCGFIIKMIHAMNEAQAEALLKQKREPRPLGEDA